MGYLLSKRSKTGHLAVSDRWCGSVFLARLLTQLGHKFKAFCDWTTFVNLDHCNAVGEATARYKRDNAYKLMQFIFVFS
jgi:hypothetical protein